MAWQFFKLSPLFIGLGTWGCDSADRGSTVTAPVEIAQVSIGVTQRNTPYLEYAGPGLMTYSHSNSSFNIQLKQGGTQFGTLSGKISFANDGSATLTVNAKLDRPVRVEVLGMKDARVRPETFDAREIVLPTGETTLEVTGVFELAYEW